MEPLLPPSLAELARPDTHELADVLAFISSRVKCTLEVNAAFKGRVPTQGPTVPSRHVRDAPNAAAVQLYARCPR